MSRRLVGAAFIVIIVIGLTAHVTAKGPKRTPPPVVVGAVVAKVVQTRVTLLGTTEPYKESVVAAQESGLVKSLGTDEGLTVRPGQTLAILDAQILDLNIKAKEAAKREAQANYIQAAREYKRQLTLYRRKVSALKNLDQTRYGMMANSQRVARLDFELRLLRRRKANKAITAPFAGLVVKRHTQVGQWVTVGGPVFTVAKLDPIIIRVPVPEAHIAAVKPGQKVRITFDALPGQAREGAVLAVISEGDKSAHTFPVKVSLKNPGARVKAGMTAKVTFAVGRPHRALLVPVDAIYTTPNKRLVYAVLGGRAVPVPVRLGPVHGNLIEVYARLRPGWPVVVVGNERLRPGQAVRIVGPDFKPLDKGAGGAKGAGGPRPGSVKNRPLKSASKGHGTKKP